MTEHDRPQIRPATDESRKSKKAGNMHADTQPWDDTCSCEPEPRWQAVEDEADTEAKDDEE